MGGTARVTGCEKNCMGQRPHGRSTEAFMIATWSGEREEGIVDAHSSRAVESTLSACGRLSIGKRQKKAERRDSFSVHGYVHGSHQKTKRSQPLPKTLRRNAVHPHLCTSTPSLVCKMQGGASSTRRRQCTHPSPAPYEWVLVVASALATASAFFFLIACVIFLGQQGLESDGTTQREREDGAIIAFTGGGAVLLTLACLIHQVHRRKCRGRGRPLLCPAEEDETDISKSTSEVTV